MAKLTDEQMETIKELSEFNKDFKKLLDKYEDISPELIVMEAVSKLTCISMELVPAGVDLRDVFLEAVEVGIIKYCEEENND